MAARTWAQQIIAYVEHTSVSGETWTLIKKGTCTSNGASDGTTVIDTNSDSSGADAYNGAYWIEILTGTCQGEWGRIVDDNGSGTYTIEGVGFSAQIDSADEFQIWLSPEPVIVADSGSLTTTTFAEDDRNEADDFWKDYYAVPITGTLRGQIKRITAFDQTGGASEGLFTCEAFTVAPSAGDVILLRKFIMVEPTPGLAQPYIPRLGQRQNFGRAKGTVGPRSGTYGFNSHIRPSGSLVAAGSVASPSIQSGLLKACGWDESTPTSMTVGAGSSTTVVKVSAGHHERVSVGDAVMWNGHLRFVTDKDDNGASPDDITVSPALPNTPASSDTLYAIRTYKKSTSGDVYGVLLEWEVDGIRHTMTGCKGNVAFQPGSPLVAAYSFNVDHYVEQYAPAPFNPAAAYTTQAPILDSDREFWLDSTKTSVEGLTFSLNTAVVRRMVQGNDGINGGAGFQITDIAPGGSFRELLDSSGTSLPQILRWLQGTTKDMVAVYGSHGRAFGLRVPVMCLVERPGLENAGGLVGAPQVWQAKDAGQMSYDTDNGGTDDTFVTIPDMAIAIA